MKARTKVQRFTIRTLLDVLDCVFDRVLCGWDIHRMHREENVHRDLCQQRLDHEKKENQGEIRENFCDKSVIKFTFKCE